MKITESQLRKIVRQEIMKEGVGFTHMSSAGGSDRAIQKHIETLGVDTVLQVFSDIEREMGFDQTHEVKRRELLNRLSDMSTGDMY